MEEIGCERHYETMVFRINSDGSVDFTELMIRGIEFKMNEGEDYRDAAERHDRLAEEMHDQVCQHVATNHADVLRGGAE